MKGNEEQKKTSEADKAKNNEHAKKYRATKTAADRAKCNEYERKRRAEKTSEADKAKNNERAKKYRANKTAADRAKRNEYERKRRAEKTSDTSKAKNNEHVKKCRAKKTAAESSNCNAHKNTQSSEQPSEESKAKPREYMKQYKAQTNANCMEKLISSFDKSISMGPLYICTCCDQLWYRHSVHYANKMRQNNPSATKFLCNKVSVDDIEWLCKTCYKYLGKNKIPPCAIINGMKFTEKPAFFDLNELECRLLVPRIAFQNLMQAPRDKQLKIYGNIVNVPANVIDTVNSLPQTLSDTSTIKINLKRKLQYKSSALSLNVRPNKVVEAALWLIRNSELYKDEGVSFNQSCMANYEQELINQENEKNPVSLRTCSTTIIDNTEMSEVIDDNEDNTDDNNDGECSEDEVEPPSGVSDTMLTPTDFLDDNCCDRIMNVAPAEGNKPSSIFQDKYSEEMAYPGIFLGQNRPDNKQRKVNVHYSDICKSELRQSDRRAAMCIENIFFRCKKLQMKILLSKAQIALRKCKGNKRTLNAGNLKQQGALDRLLRFDEGFKFLRALRGSPPYFEKAKKDLFAMIRQLGTASLFCSFSSAETQWTHLLKILGNLVDNKEYTNEEINNFNWEERCRLIQSDPVTCSRHFSSDRRPLDRQNHALST